MMERISIIVLIYRVEKYLDQCIQSILNQTYKDLEIILVDDGSDDACPKICDDYAKKDCRIKVIHKSNSGIDDARKAGILAATGNYVGYVDGDDWIESNMYEKLFQLMKSHDVDVVESGVFDSWGTTEEMRVPFIGEGCYKNEDFSKDIGPRILYSGNFFQFGISPYLVSKLFLKDRLLKYQLMPEPSNNIVDDVMCTFPCIMESRSIYITHECFYHYRVREDSAKRLIRNDIATLIIKCYPDWIRRFDGAKSSDHIDLQIQYFTLYLLIAKAVYIFDHPQSEFYLISFGKIRKRDKLVLYGAGMVGIHLKNYIDSVMGSNLIYWADRNYRQLCKDYQVQDPGKIVELDYDYVIISILSERAVESAKKSLVDIGIPANKILWIAEEFISEPNKLLKHIIYNE